MNLVALTPEQQCSLRPGEPLTLAAVMLVFTAVLFTIVAYKLFTSRGAKIQLPNGYKFEWTNR